MIKSTWLIDYKIICYDIVTFFDIFMWNITFLLTRENVTKS